MKKFICTFVGRKVGAIGKSYKNRITLYCENIDEVNELLYKDFENITNLKIQ